MELDPYSYALQQRRRAIMLSTDEPNLQNRLLQCRMQTLKLEQASCQDHIPEDEARSLL